MLFVVLRNAKGGTSKERTERRMTWKIPEGTRLIGEYWLTNEYPNVVQIIETDNVQVMLNAISDWDDNFDISINPAITAEEGMKNVQEMM